MLDLEENKRLLIELNNKLSDIKETMQIEKSIQKISVLEQQTLSEDFWEDTREIFCSICRVKFFEKENI